MRSSRVAPFLLSTLLCGALVAAGMGEDRLGMADDLESPAVMAPDQIEPEAPPRSSADLSDEIDQFDDCAKGYYYRYGYEYAAQQDSGDDDVDVTDDCETEDYSYDSEEFVYDGPCQKSDAEDSDSRDYSQWYSKYGYHDYDDYEHAAEDTQDVASPTADDTSDEELSYDYQDNYQDEYGYKYEEEYTANDEEMEEEVASEVSEYNCEEDYVYDYATDDNLLAADSEDTEEESEETSVQAQDSALDDPYNFEYDEEYSYDYEDEYMTEEYVHGSDEATQSDVEDDVENVQEDGFAYKYGEEYSYDYEDECRGEEDDCSTGETAQSDVEDDVENAQEDDFTYEYDEEEYSYDYKNECMAQENDCSTGETAQSDVEDDSEETQENGFSYKDDIYGFRYGYEYLKEDTEPVEKAELDAEPEEPQPSYFHGNWEDEYDSEYDNESHGYTTEYDEYGEYMYQPETEAAQAEQTESDSQFEKTGSWESECDEPGESESEYDEYGDYTYDSEIEKVEAEDTDNDSRFDESGSWESEYDDYSGHVDDEMEADAPAEDDLGVYGGYTDAYPEEEHAYPEPEAQDVVQEEPESSCDTDEFGYDCCDAQVNPSEESTRDDYWTEYGYEYSYPETKYGSADAVEEEMDLEDRLEGEPGEPAHAMEECPDEDLPCGVELFAWHPSELLSFQDQEILRTLKRLCEDPSGVRRATLNDYLEELGSDAIEFAGRFEDFSGIDVLGLADDLPGTAAFLASFRLLRRGELGIDEAADVLRHSLANLSPDWIKGVEGITADAFKEWDAGIDQSEEESADWFEMTRTASPIVDAMASIASRSVIGAKDAIATVSAQLGDMELSTLLRQLSED